MSEPIASKESAPLVPLSQVPRSQVSWLWPGRLALGKLGILEGDPGLGKSLLALDLCARITAGRALPECDQGGEPGNVLILNGEDGAADTVRPRLENFQADLDRVFVRGLEDEGPGPLLCLPSQVETFGRYLAETRPRLVVIDPILAFLDRSISTADDASVRRALHPLAVLAARQQCAILLIRHLNKKSSPAPVYRGEGSIGFLAACRSAWLVAVDPEQAERRVLAQVKNNLAAPQVSLVFAVSAQPGSQPLLSWLGATQRRAGELLAGVRMGFRPRDFAREQLENFLLEKPRTSPQVWKFATEKNIAEMTLRRAKEELQVKAKRVWLNGRRTCYWLLPGQELPQSKQDNGTDELEPWLVELRQQYPEAAEEDGRGAEQEGGQP